MAVAEYELDHVSTNKPDLTNTNVIEHVWNVGMRLKAFTISALALPS